MVHNDKLWLYTCSHNWTAGLFITFNAFNTLQHYLYFMELFLVSISTDFVGVMVRGGCHSQGCHGYLHALLKAHILASSSLRHLSQAHLLMMSLAKHYTALLSLIYRNTTHQILMLLKSLSLDFPGIGNMWCDLWLLLT